MEEPLNANPGLPIDDMLGVPYGRFTECAIECPLENTDAFAPSELSAGFLA